jgi:hypothetical protein
MEEFAYELLNKVSLIEKERLCKEIKKELATAGRSDLWKKIELYAELETTVNIFEILK